MRGWRSRVALLLVVCGASCERAAREPPARYLPPPAPSGIAVATVEVVAPPGNADRKIFAGLKREGRILARGEATVPASGPATVILHAMEPSTVLPDGECELWMTIDRDGLQSCYPSFGDLYVRQRWSLGRAARTMTLADPTVWTQRTLSEPGNLITIHYHRFDEDYDNVGIWTWDGHYRQTPEQNEIFEVGYDDYGLVFQIDRAEYGGSDKIGLLPRLAGDWNRKDGEDKFWRPAMGREVYLIGGRAKIWTERPDTGPQVVAAYIDTPTRLVLELSRLVQPGEIGAGAVAITDDAGNLQRPAAVRVVLGRRKDASNFLELTTGAPLALAQRSYRVAVEGFAGEVQAVPRGVLDDPALFSDAEAVLGARYSAEATTFRVFAPTARAVNVVLYDEPVGERGRAVHPMQPAGKGIWECKVAGDLEGKFYVYALEGEGLLPEREVLDIYAVNAVRSSTRARITELARTNPPNWERLKAGPRVESPVDIVVYEMHVRDFTIAGNSPARPEHRGKYPGFAEAVDHLVELGVTHVQLMPLQDFENDETTDRYNWGYVTTAFNTPEGWFATNIDDDSRIREFKQLVAALHERGIGVILDVVYNHTANSAPFNLLVPRYYFRLNADGSYSNGSGCGNDFRTEAPMARKFILDSLKYWVSEYGIDGFRFDLMALMDLETMKQVERELRAIRPDIILYGEPWAAGSSPLRGQPTNKQTIRGTRIGAFNDEFRNALIGSPFEKTHTGFVQDGSQRQAVKRGIEGSWRGWAPTPAHTINYMTCHDNYVLWDKLKFSKPDATEAELKEMMKLGYLLLFTAQGVPFIHGGEEFARSKQGHHNSYDAPDEINQVDWSLKEKNHDVFTYTRDLIALRRAHPIFRLRAREQIAAWLKFHDTTDPNTLMWTLDGSALENEPWKKVCVLVNAADHMSADFALPAGPWHVAFDHRGPVREERVVEGTIRVRYKSGMILYQP